MQEVVQEVITMADNATANDDSRAATVTTTLEVIKTVAMPPYGSEGLATLATIFDLANTELARGLKQKPKTDHK